MIQKIFVTSLFAVLFVYGSAQNISLKVIVKNERKESVQNATVRILRQPDSAVLQVKTSKDDVIFLMPESTPYFIEVTAVGYTDFFQSVSAGIKDTVIMAMLQIKSKNLETVVVTARKPFIKQEDDKTIVDAEVLAESSTNAFEVLEKTPGAILDQDGNVYLNSATPATIFINGREIKLSASDLSSLLKSLPANSISKIEILRSPSAKYDAASSGGIVNIVLKKGVKLGTNGSIDVSHFQGRYATESAGFNINRNADKLNSYLSYNFTDRKNFEVYNSERIVNAAAVFKQLSYTKFHAVNNYASAGLDYEINKKWSIGYDIRMTANNSGNDVSNDININLVNGGSKIGENVSLVKNNGPSFYISNDFSSKYKIDSAGSEWTNSLNYNHFNSGNEQQYSNIHIQPSKNTLNGDGNTNNNKNIFSYKTDLIYKPGKSLTIEAGGKYNLSNSKNSANFFADTSTGRYPDRFQTNSFTYKENIGAAYFQIAKKIGGFTIKPGLRLEATDIRGHQIIPSDTTFAIKRTDLFPYLYLRHTIAKLFGFTLTGNLIARRSISRPYYESLNPYPKYIDQYTYESGNPGLQPQFTNNYEFNVMADEFPVFSFGLNDIKNIFTNVTYSKGDTLFRTFDNLGTNKEVYMRAVAGIPPGKKYFFYAGTQLNIINYNGQYSGVPFQYKRSTWTFFMYHNFKPLPTLNLSLNAFMRVHGVFNFFELAPFGGVAITANKSIAKKKMNIVVSVNDLLRTNRNSFEINQPNFTASGNRYADTRKLGIALKYNFGIKPKEEKKPSFEVPETN